MVVGFIRGRWVYSGAPWGSSGSFGIVGFIRVFPGGRCVHSRSLGSFRCALAVPGGHRVHSESLAPWWS